MAKWYGKVGYVIPTETKPGVYRPKVTEYEYYGDIISNRRRTQTADKLNDDIVIQNTVSIIADPFALESLQYIRYVTFMKANWEVSGIEVQYPRLILTLGGIYNGTNEGRST